MKKQEKNLAVDYLKTKQSFVYHVKKKTDRGQKKNTAMVVTEIQRLA